MGIAERGSEEPLFHGIWYAHFSQSRGEVGHPAWVNLQYKEIYNELLWSKKARGEG